MERQEHNQAGWEGQKPEDAIRDWISQPNLLYTDKDVNIKGLFTVNDQKMNLSGIGASFARKTVSQSVYSAASNDYILGVTNLGVAPTIGLPRPKIAGFGTVYIVKDEVGGASGTTITVVSQGGENIDGASSSTITSNYASKSFYTDGANWFTF